MAAITKVELWKDTGFIDGAVEIPAVYSADPVNPDMVLEPDLPISPSKDRFFSEIKVKGYFIELMEMSYLKVTYEFNEPGGSSLPKEFYGWVSDVTISSDGEMPMTVISWHIDEWRTWRKYVTFGSGHVKRRPFRDLDSTPIQNYPVRYYKLGSDDIAINNILSNSMGDIWWVIVSINRTESGTGVTYIRQMCFPVPANLNPSYRTYFKIYNANTNTLETAHGLNLKELYDGILDEEITAWIGAPPDAINGVWLSPICPFTSNTPSGTGTLNDPLDYGTLTTLYVDSGKIAAVPLSSNKVEYDKAISPAIKSSEEKLYILCSMDGVKALDIPYDFEVTNVHTTIVTEPNGPFIEISFRNATYGNLEGMTVNVPLLSLPLNDNAYSSYVYSGQQEYDREKRTVRSNSDAWKSAASGGSTGALFGAVGPIGALAGGAAGAVPGLVNYGVEMLYQNDAEQNLENRLKANQPSSMIVMSNALLSIIRNYAFKIKSIVPDDYSAAQIVNTRNQFGISVDELLPSTDTLLKVTSPKGYYNIQNLIITGDIPVSAKKWIRNKFASGVRLI